MYCFDRLSDLFKFLNEATFDPSEEYIAEVSTHSLLVVSSCIKVDTLETNDKKQKGVRT